MKPNLHELHGCAPNPLAHYLKALGILRIVAEQLDPEARGWWEGEHFCLLTILDRESLERFFLDSYSPTPFVAPWNKGSGFFNPTDRALVPLANSEAPRFALFREGIVASRAQLQDLSKADAEVRALKASTKNFKGMSRAEAAEAERLKTDPAFKAELAAADRRFKAMKIDLFTPCARTWRGAHRAWFDAAVVLQEAEKPIFPALLGTGGNDGRLDFTNNAMKRLAELFVVDSSTAPARPTAGPLLRNALWGDPVAGLQQAPIGQFSPGQAGGANATTGPESSSLTNAWDFVLMLEGAVLFSARATRRLDPQAASRVSAPFVLRAQACGHGTAGDEKSDRGEQWMPIWRQPSSMADIRSLIGEGRLQAGRRTANRPLDAARAVATLGAARGISSFERFGYLERNGLSNFAVPLGRIAVRETHRAHLVQDIADWMDRLRRAVRKAKGPARLVQAERSLADAVFAALTHDDGPARWQGVLLAAQRVEAIQSSGTAFSVGPIPRLSPGWLAAANDDSVEWRLACALGSAGAAPPGSHASDSVRHHWLPLDPKQEWRFQTSDQGRRLTGSVRVVVSGRDAVTDAIAVVERRLIESVQHGSRHLPLVGAPGYEAGWGDLAMVLAGGVDLDRSFALAQALMALNWRKAPRGLFIGGSAREWPDPAWLAVRCCCLPYPLADGRRINCDSAMVRRLAAGDASSAVAIAVRRLAGVGTRAPLRAGATDPVTARLWAAAIVFPIPLVAASRALDYLDPHSYGANLG